MSLSSSSSDVDSKYRNLQGITLVPRGFLIPKAPLANQWLIQRAIAELTFEKADKKFGAGIKRTFFGKKEPPIRVFIDAEHYVLVPKQWGLTTLRGKPVPISNQNEDGEEVELRYRADMPLFEDRRRPQQSAVKFALEQLRKNGAALVEMPVGTGKTNVALKIAAECRVKTLWLAHRHNLLEQCAERAAEFLPGIQIGWLYADKLDIENKQLVLGMIQTLESKTTFDPAMFRQFGLVILDEAHHAAARSFVDALFIVAAPRMLAVTACAKRKDGLDSITNLFFSEHKYIVKPTLPDGLQLHIRTWVVHRRSHILEPDLCDALYRRKHLKALAAFGSGEEAEERWREKIDSKPDNVSEGGYSVLCSELARIAPLNALAVAMIKKALLTIDANQYGDITVEEMRDTAFVSLHDRSRSSVLVLMQDTGEKIAFESVAGETERVRRHMRQCERQVFVACAHKSMVDSLQKRLVRSGVPEHMIGTYYGDLHASLRAQALQKRVVLVTYSMAEEGLDVPTANTLLIKQSRGSSALQTVGRVLRDKMSKTVEPMVLDCYSDWCAMDQGMFWQRHAEFKKYPHCSKMFHIGKKVKAQSDITPPIASYFGSSIDIDDARIQQENHNNEEIDAIDLRIDEAGALSLPPRTRAVAPTEANKKRKKMSKAEKQEAREAKADAKKRRDMQHVAFSASSAGLAASASSSTGANIIVVDEDEEAEEEDEEKSVEE